MKLLRALLSFLLFVVLFYISGALVFFVMSSINKRKYIQTVGKDIPPKFPVLVIWPAEPNGYDARIVYHEQLEELLNATENASFMVPEGHEEEIHERINARHEEYAENEYDPSFSHFKIEEKAENYQLLEVGYTWDDDFENTGWYEANKNGFIPKRYLHYFWGRPGRRMLVIFLILAMSIALWYSCRFGFRYALKKIRTDKS